MFQSTPDYTIAHQQFHESAPHATPYLLGEGPRPIVAATPDVEPYEKQFYEGQLRALAAAQAARDAEKPERDLPPGYVALPAMIEPPPGYQLFRSNHRYY